MKRLLPIIAAGFLWSCGGGGIQIPNCFKDGCPPGKECREVAAGIGLCFDVTGTATPVATPAGTSTPGHTSTPTLTPQATATPQATPTQPAATATPQATQTPCSTSVQKVCLKNGIEYPLAECWTCRAQIPGVMNLTDYWAGSYWTPGDPLEDSDARSDGKFPKGLWLNDNGHDQWQCVSKRTCDRVKCDDPGTVISPFAVMFPPAVTEVVRACPTPGPTVTPQATPGATPTPGPGCQIPSSCPVLSRWGVSPNPLFTFNGVQVPDARVGGRGSWDSTPRFGGGNGLPCNDEHHVPCTSTVPGCGHVWRQCEDPRGPVWSVSGPAQIKDEDGFGVTVLFTGVGQVTVQACPRPDAHDHYGVPLNTGPGACASRFVTVR